jgi:hypothetical protein
MLCAVPTRILNLKTGWIRVSGEPHIRDACKPGKEHTGALYRGGTRPTTMPRTEERKFQASTRIELQSFVHEQQIPILQ